jgi:hypothetical protein
MKRRSQRDNRDVATLCAFGVRLIGLVLVIWGPSKESFYTGLALAAGAEPSVLRALIKPK